MIEKIKYTADNMISTILHDIPEYDTSWQEHVKYWGNDPERTIGIDSMNFASFVVDKTKNQFSKDFLIRVFDLIERFLEFGNEDVEHAAMSFLQDFTNALSHYSERIPFGSYIPLLGPRSKAFCRYLDGLYGTKTPGL